MTGSGLSVPSSTNAWTYVACDHSLVDEILASRRSEAIGVEPTDRW